MINGLFGFNSFLLSCSVFDCLFVCLHPLLFWHHRCSSNHNSPRGIYSLPFLAPMLISPFQKHSNLPFGFIPAQFCSNTGPQCKIRDKQKENKAFSSWVDSCHTIPSTPPWTWSRLEPGVAAAYLAAAAPSRAPTQTPQAGQTGCYKLGSRTVAIFTRCRSDAKCKHQSNRIYSALQTSFSGQSAP